VKFEPSQGGNVGIIGHDDPHGGHRNPYNGADKNGADDTPAWRGIAACVVMVILLLPFLAMLRTAGIGTRAKTLYRKGSHAIERIMTPTLLEHSDGYRPAGEIPVPGKRSEDHIVRIVRSGRTDRYVCWTNGTLRRTTLTIPGAKAQGVQGRSLDMHITLRHRPSVIFGTPYINAKNVINATDAGLVGNGVTDNTARLNAILRLLPESVKKTVTFPDGHFAFTGVINMVSNLSMVGRHAHTFIQMPAHRHGGMVIWYPAGKARGYDGMHDVEWKSIIFRGDYSDLTPTQTIYQPLIHAHNIVYDDCTFNMVQRPYGHVLDVDGSSGVTVRNSTVIGSPNRGQTFKEAFQMDVAARGASGYYDKQTVFNRLPTKDMTIEHNRFLPLRNAEGTLLLPSAAPFGTHMAYALTTADDSYIHHGIFKDNYVEDPVYYEGAGTENSAVIHFDAANDITISGNTFVWTGETPQSSWAVAFYARSRLMVKPSQWHGIRITDNVFKGFAPSKGAFTLYREAGSVSGPGRSLSDVVISHNTFKGTPLRTALHWLHDYSGSFVTTYGQRIQGSDNTVDDAIRLDATSSTTHSG
jgi:hypothetical protein